MTEINPNSSQFSFIGNDLYIEGNIQVDGELQIHGRVKGQILDKNIGGKVIIGPLGEVDGHIECDHIEVYGHVKGSLDIKGKAIFRSSSSMDGHIKAKSLSIFPGAEINMEGHTL